MLPPMWRIEACMNIAVKTVSQVGIVPGSDAGCRCSAIAGAGRGLRRTPQCIAGVGQRVRDRAVLDDLLGVGPLMNEPPCRIARQ